MKTIMNEQQAELAVTWRTPLGPMRGLIGERGIQALHFPAPEDQTLEVWPSAAGGVELVDGPTGNKLVVPPSGGIYEELNAPDATPVVEAVTEWLRYYFAGRPTGPLPPLDFAGASAFDRAVWEATVKIPRGAVKTYGQIAGEIGRPGSARAVGGALGRNPLVLLIPCHRVISSAGGARALCGFTGGLPLKRYLLDLEGITMA